MGIAQAGGPGLRLAQDLPAPFSQALAQLN